MKKMKVIAGQYEGKIGYIYSKPNYLDLVMFYPVEGSHPYRVCLEYKNLIEVE